MNLWEDCEQHLRFFLSKEGFLMKNCLPYFTIIPGCMIQKYKIQTPVAFDFVQEARKDFFLSLAIECNASFDTNAVLFASRGFFLSAVDAFSPMILTISSLVISVGKERA